MTKNLLKNILGPILAFRLLIVILSGFADGLTPAQILGTFFLAVLYLAAVIGVFKFEKKGLVVALLLVLLHLYVAVSNFGGLNTIETVNLVLDFVLLALIFISFRKFKTQPTP